MRLYCRHSLVLAVVLGALLVVGADDYEKQIIKDLSDSEIPRRGGDDPAMEEVRASFYAQSCGQSQACDTPPRPLIIPYRTEGMHFLFIQPHLRALCSCIYVVQVSLCEMTMRQPKI
jgi:hypothetical protein